MKKNLLIVALALGMLTPAIAQFKAANDDGIVASPKLRERLDAQNARVAASPVVTATPAKMHQIASPRSLETLGTPAAVTVLPVATKDYAAKANCTGGPIVGSPKALDMRLVAANCCGAGPCMTACAR